MLIQNRVLKNASWIVGCKIVQALLNFLISIFTLRFLGPSNAGLVTYAASITAFFIPIMRLGFSSTLVQEFIKAPEAEGKTLGTALVFNLFSALLSILGIVSFSLVANPHEPETILVCFLYSLTLLFQTLEMFQYWFQSKFLSKYPSIAALIAYALVSIYKIFILASGKTVHWFAVSHVLEVLFVGVLLFWFYKRNERSCALSFSFSLGRQMLRRSFHYIPSALMVTAIQQTDHIMLKLISGNASAGLYHAAISCIGITAFVFSAILDSARPSILESRLKDPRRFEEKTVLLFFVITAVSLLQALAMTVLARPVIPLLYGEDFLPTAAILSVSAWYVPFAYIGMVRDIWILAEQKQRYLWIINLCGLFTNLLLNALLIPLWNGIGAAFASLVTHFFTNVILTLLIKPLRPCGKLMLRSLEPRFIASLISHKKKEN